MGRHLTPRQRLGLASSSLPAGAQPTVAAMSNQATRILKPSSLKTSETWSLPQGQPKSIILVLSSRGYCCQYVVSCSYPGTVQMCGIDSELTLVPTGLASLVTTTPFFFFPEDPTGESSSTQPHCASGQVPCLTGSLREALGTRGQGDAPAAVRVLSSAQPLGGYQRTKERQA